MNTEKKMPNYVFRLLFINIKNFLNNIEYYNSEVLT